MDNTDYKQTLIQYLPDKAVSFILEMIYKDKVSFKISRPRTTKLGDYRPPYSDMGHRISVNGNLNKYAFLLTLLHEFAHLEAWKIYSRKIRPHGKEWLFEYRKLLKIFIHEKMLPEDISKAVVNCFFIKSNISSSGCEKLDDILRNYSDEPPLLRIKDIPEVTVFTLKNGRKFKKIEKLRKRYKCRDLGNGRLYLVHPLAEVIKIE